MVDVVDLGMGMGVNFVLDLGVDTWTCVPVSVVLGVIVMVLVLAWEELELGFLVLIDDEGVVSRDDTHEVKLIIFWMYEAIVDYLMSDVWCLIEIDNFVFFPVYTFILHLNFNFPDT